MNNLDLCSSNDERIKSYMISDDWKDELDEAEDRRWFVDEKRFNTERIIKKYEKKKYNKNNF